MLSKSKSLRLYTISYILFHKPIKVGIPRAVRKIVSKLSESGWLYNKVRKYADSRSTDRAFGLVGQVGCSIRNNMSEQIDDF